MLVLCLLSGFIAAASSCDIETYYADVDVSLRGSALKAELQKRIASPHDVIPYTSSSTDVWDALSVLDADPSNAKNVIEIYTGRSVPAALSGEPDGGWNREHLFPKSCGVGFEGPDFSDLHHLMASDWNVNSARGNKDFGDCIADDTPSCTSPAHPEAPGTADDVETFLPPPAVRGDIARRIFYMATRYDGNEKNTLRLKLASACGCDESGRLGNYAWLRAWHDADPVDDGERLRNDRVCEMYQGNRNPYVDFPELVARVFDAADESEVRERACSEATDDGGADDFVLDDAVEGLKAGDALFVGARFENPDDFALVFLVASPGVDLEITDNGWSKDGSFRDTEGVLRLRLADVAAGGVATLADTVPVSGSFALGSRGDQLIVRDPSTGRFITALQTGGGWSDASSSATSALPPGLKDGKNALALDYSADAVAYTGPRSGSAEDLRGYITDEAYWARGDFDASPFTVDAAARPRLAVYAALVVVALGMAW